MADAMLPLPGHSLGGALAQLAAHDISTAAAAEGLHVRVVCYTFGAPRVGSSAREGDYPLQQWTRPNERTLHQLECERLRIKCMTTLHPYAGWQPRFC